MDVIDSALVPDNIADYAKAHLRRYLASNGQDGHLKFQVINDGRPPAPPTLLLAAQGRKSGKWYIWPLTYGTDGDRYLVVGSRGGAPDHPGWAKNLMANPQARIQVGDKRLDVTSTVATGAERTRLWDLMVGVLPEYARYQKKTTRELPVFILSPKK
jgi:proline iminopeptidase